MDNGSVSDTHVKYVSDKTGISEEIVRRVLEADTEYLDVIISELSK